MKKPGQSLHEYALAVALIALLSLGSLQLFGGNLDRLLRQTSNPGTLAETEKLYALIGTDLTVQGSASGTRTGGPQMMTSPGMTTATLKLDPRTGRVLITSTSSGETNATSLDGGGLMALASTQLAALADFKAADEQPLPDNVQLLLKQLANSGTELSQQYEGFSSHYPAIEQLHRTIAEQQQLGQQEGPPYYDSAFVTETMHYTDQYIQFSQTYNQLEQELAQLDKQSPAYAELKAQISSYAGSISGIAFHEIGQPFYSQFHIGNVQQADLAAALSANPQAAQYFQQLEARAATLPTSQRESVFRKGVVSLAEGMMVGTPIQSGTPLTLSLPTMALPGLEAVSSSRSE